MPAERHSARLTAALILLLGLGAQARAAAAAPPATGPSSVVGAPATEGPVPWSIRTEGVVNLDGPGFGVDVSRVFNSRLALEGSVGLALFERSRGDAVDLVVQGRAGWFGRRHGLSVGLGPRWFYAPSTYGHIAFVHSELAYEYRRAGGISLLAGYGISMALNRSGAGHCSDGSLLCTERFEAGQFTPRVRFAVGYSF